MPIYDFKCKQCEKQFETMTSFSEFDRWQKEQNTIPCPFCAATKVEKLISTGTSFSLKGRGWTGKINPKRR
jgi:putative FmdB family regulatory protein